MPIWNPSPKWNGQDACIIGGGSSLQNFPFEKLTGRNVIGCNDAFRLGSAIVPYCIFGDQSFWNKHHWELENFAKEGGKVVSVSSSVSHLNLSWLLQMKRIRDGFSSGDTLGWNLSTGAAAVNLAITLGATMVFLLGFDMSRNPTTKKTHWHAHRLKPIQDSAYANFIRGFRNLEKGMAGKTNAKVFNVTDGSSKLPVFPRITFDEFEMKVGI